MFGLGSHEQVYGSENPEHQSKFSYELVAGAISFAATKMYEDRQRKEGKEVKHAFAKEAIAGLIVGEADKLFETKGLDHLDKERVKREAQKQFDQQYPN